MWQSSEVKELVQNSNLNYKEISNSSRRITIKDFCFLIKEIKKNNYDIIIGFGIRVSMLFRLLKPFIRKTPMIIGLRGLDKWRKWYHVWPDRLTEFACDMFIPNSNAVACQRMEREKTSAAKMVIIKNGINVSCFNKSRVESIPKSTIGLPDNKLLITSVGNFRYQKGYDFLIDVIKSFPKWFENVHFIWIGAGELKNGLSQRIESIGVADKITILGKVKNVRPLLSISDIFVMSSREEGMPRALMEAMAMSLPCVATSVGGTKEVVENGINGFLSDFGDIEAFADNIRQLIESSELRKQIGAAARKRIVEHFGIEIIARRFIRLFECLKSGYRDGRKIQKEISDIV